MDYDAAAFYERSTGLIGNGHDQPGQSSQDPELRPSALYFATNLRTSGSGTDPGIDRGGWVNLTYGEGGNVVSMTVRARCHDPDGSTACYDDDALSTFDARDAHLRDHCVCTAEQHYQYRWDEVNRLAEARRYEISSTTTALSWESCTSTAGTWRPTRPLRSRRSEPTWCRSPGHDEPQGISPKTSSASTCASGP